MNSSVLNTADILTMILAGGEGRRLYPLTSERAKPAVPFGGRYRIIDFVLSNFVNSGFYRIKVLTQYKSDSLNKHLSRGWNLSTMVGHYVEAVPPQQRTGPDWFKGSADAIYQNMNLITDERPRIVCVFGADHIFKMDVRQMVQFHLTKKSACTIAAIPVPVDEARAFGVIEIDEDWQIVGFQEKPAKPREIPDRPGWALASMGNYVFDIDPLVDVLKRDAGRADSKHDFGQDILPSLMTDGRMFAYDFSTNRVPGMHDREVGYWRDVGDLDAYFAANMDLVSVTPTIDIHNPAWPIHTFAQPAAPAKFVFADDEHKRMGVATDSLVSEGCIVSGGRLDRCVLSRYVRVNSYSRVDHSILLDEVVIGRHAQVRNAIIDKHAHIKPGAKVGYDDEADRARFHITKKGIVVVPKGAVVD